MEPISMTLLLGSTALAAGGELFKGFAGSEAGRLKSMIAESNARWLKQQGDIERGFVETDLLRGAFEATKFLRAGERVASGQTAYFGANGIDPLYGSPLVLAGATIAQASVDAALATARGASEAAAREGRVAQAYGQSAGQAGAALGYQQNADAALIAGVFGAGAQLLGGAAKAWGGLTTAPPKPNVGGGFPINLAPPVAQPAGAFNAWDLH